MIQFGAKFLFLKLGEDHLFAIIKVITPDEKTKVFCTFKNLGFYC